MEFDSIKRMPHSVEAEQSVIGSIIIDPKCVELIIQNLKPDHFYVDKYQKIYETLIGMFLDSKPIDFVTALSETVKAGIFDEVEGKRVLYDMTQLVPSTSNVTAYAKIIEEKAYLRNLINACDDITKACYEQIEDATKIVDMAESRIYEIMQDKVSTSLTDIKTAIFKTYDQISKAAKNKGELLGVKSGFAVLDQKLAGLGNSDLVLIAARPGMGKTAFALNIAQNAGLLHKKTVAIFSLEMSNEQLTSRMLSSESNIDSFKFRTGDLSENEWVRLSQAATVLSGTKVFMDDTPGITVAQMKAKLRRIKDLDLVIVDYLQLMQSSGKSDNRTQEVGDISRSLKMLAKEFNVPVITLSQLSRGPESRTDKRPMLSDLRESGAIEQDADVVLFLYRDDYYNEDSEKRNIAECIISKNRHGETGTVELQWNAKSTTFSDLEKYLEP